MLSLSLLITLLSIIDSSLGFTFPSLSSLFPHFGGSNHTSTKFSQQEKLIDLSSLGLPKTGQISAFGDFNSDQLLDLVYLSYDQRSVTVWNWDNKSYQWKEDGKKLVRTRSGFRITNVLTGDFDRDGKLDLVLMGMQHPGWKGDKHSKTEILLYLQGTNGTFLDPIELDPSSAPQPIVFDALGTMTSSFLGFPPSSSSTSSSPSSPQLWIPSTPPGEGNFTYSTTDASLRFDYDSHPSGKGWQCKFPTPHFNHFLDLNGDCLADLFLTCLNEDGSGGKGGSDLRYEIWINDKIKGKFVYKRGGDLPQGTRTVGFSDFDRDGTLDMILTVCPTNNRNSNGGDKDCSIQIAYNDQIPLCSTTTSTSSSDAEGEDCRDIENLCVADDQFSFNLTDSPDNPSLSKFKVSSKEDLIPDHTLLTKSSAFQGELPVSPQIGDYNIDGYPDFLLLVSPLSHPSQRIAKLLQSRPCTVGKCTSLEIKRGRRWFELVETEGEAKGISELTKFKDVETVHWLDLDEDGSLDIVLQRTGQSGSARVIHFLKNNWFNDAFFLKAMVLNGACQNWCQPKEPGPGQERYRPYGSSYSGASFKFTVLDPTGARRSTQYAQLPYTSYLSLGLPSAYLGLGRTNNYVENLFIGSTRSHQSNHFINLEGVIPNSQVLILPFQSKEAPTTTEEGEVELWEGDTSEWRKELYLKPGDWIPWVTLVLVTAIIGLGIVVFVLHLNEKREDEVERRARLLSLNFGAL